MPRLATTFFVLLLLAAGIWWFASTRDPSLPPDTEPAQPTSSAAAAVQTALPEAATGPADATARVDQTPLPSPSTPAWKVRGTILADRRAPDLSGARVLAYRGEASDQSGNLMGGMTGSASQTRNPAFVLKGESIASAEVTPAGDFVLHTDSPHLRLTLDHALYTLPVPEIVHVPTTTKAADTVLRPLLGGCVRGQLLGELRADIPEVRIVLDGDPMSMMRDTRLFLGAMIGSRRPAAVPDANGKFVFRAVLPGSPITLSANGSRAIARATHPPLQPGEVREIVLAVRRAASLVVTVHDRAGPIERAGVSVRAAGLTGMTAPMLLMRRATTGPDGTARFDGLAADHSSIEAAADGHTSSTTELDLLASDEPTRVRLDLGEGGVVTGVVLSPEGKPLADARVAHMPTTDVPMFGDMSSQLGPDHLTNVAATGARTDDEGRFRLSGLADDGTFHIVASHPDYAPGQTKGVRMGDHDVTITLQPFGEVVGRVVSDAGAQPLTQFRVTLQRTAFLVMTTPVRQVSVSSSVDGAFQLTAVPPGSYTLLIEADGCSDATKDVEVQAGKLDAGTISVSAAASISGTVRDESGAPVSMALVRRRAGALNDNPMLAMFRSGVAQTYTDAQGRFQLSPLPSGRVQLLASAEGFASGRSERLQVEAGQQLSGVTIVLDHGGKIRGRLRVAAGQQPEDFLLMVQEQSTQSTQSQAAAADGTFLFENLDPGQYTIQAMPNAMLQGFGKLDWKPGQSMKFGEMFQKITDQVTSQRTSVRAGETSEVTLDVSEVSVGMTWTVHVEVGKQPLDEGFVETSELASGRIRVGFLRNGAATFGGMHSGAHRVQVRSGFTMTPVGSPQDVELPARTDAYRSTLSLPGGELRGRVVDAASGQPLRAAIVRLLNAGRAESDDPIGMALTDESGAFRFPGLADGSYSLIAEDGSANQRHGTSSRRDGIRVLAGQATEPVELRAQPAATASVLVTTASGAPLPGATVLCVDPDGHPLGALGIVTSDGEGQAWFGGMPAGHARVVGRAPGFAPAASDVQEVTPDRAVEFTLELASGATTTLQVVDRAGEPVRGAMLSARCNGGPWLPSLLLVEGMRSDGGFELGRLGRGNWEFRVSHPSLGTVLQSRSIGDEGSVTIVVVPR